MSWSSSTWLGSILLCCRREVNVWHHGQNCNGNKALQTTLTHLQFEQYRTPLESAPVATSWPSACSLLTYGYEFSPTEKVIRKLLLTINGLTSRMLTHVTGSPCLYHGLRHNQAHPSHQIKMSDLISTNHVSWSSIISRGNFLKTKTHFTVLLWVWFVFWIFDSLCFETDSWFVFWSVHLSFEISPTYVCVASARNSKHDVSRAPLLPPNTFVLTS